MAPKSTLGIQSMEAVSDGRTVSTTFNNLRVGNLPIGDGIGVPMGAIPTMLILQAPAAADVNYYYESATATTGKLTLTNTTLPTNGASGYPFARNVVVDPSGSTSGSLLFTVEDANGQIVQRTVTFVASGTTIETAWTCRRILSVEVLVSFAAVTIEIGFGNVFGLSAPMYLDSTFGLGAGISTAGNTVPIADSNFIKATDWTVTPGVPGSATADHYGTFNLIASDTDPDGTADYWLQYVSQFPYRDLFKPESFPTSLL